VAGQLDFVRFAGKREPSSRRYTDRRPPVVSSTFVYGLGAAKWGAENERFHSIAFVRYRARSERPNRIPSTAIVSGGEGTTGRLSTPSGRPNNNARSVSTRGLVRQIHAAARPVYSPEPTDRKRECQPNRRPVDIFNAS